jgi:GntR family transcriptional regulator/MocR family aminotransferase
MTFQLDRSTPGPLFEKLKGEIVRQIRLGMLRPGDRLPPTRKLAEDLGVNRGTVSTAYEELHTDGVLTSHVGRGTFVAEDLSMAAILPADNASGFRWADHFAGFEPSTPHAILRAAVPAFDGEDVVSFAGNVPDPALFPTDAFRKALDAVLREEGNALLSYGPPQGHPAFLAFLHEYLANDRGLPLREEELMVVNGSQHAIDLIARALLRPGDTVLVEEPTYYGAAELFRGYGARLVGVPMDAEGLRVEALEAVLTRERPKLVYVMPTFQNPTGGMLAPQRRRDLVRLTRRYQVPLVEDDFDGELYFDAPPPPPLRADAHGQGVIYIGTPSKMLFPGLRVGWVVAEEPVIERLSRIKQMTDLSGSQLLQAALAHFARGGGWRKHLRKVRSAYGERVERLLAALTRHMPPGVSWTRPRGGLSLMVTLPEGLDSDEILRDAAGTGVIFTPGRLFFVEGGDRHLRLSFGNVATADVEEGVKRLARAVKRARSGSKRERRRTRGMALPPV